MAMIDAETYKQALGSFPTGVCVITMQNGKTYHGVTISSLSAVSLAPPLVSFCIEHKANSYAILQNTEKVNINILSEQQQEICWHYAKHGQWSDSFAYDLVENLPVFKNVTAGMACTITQRIPAGDHDIFLCSVEKSIIDEAIKPMIYVRGKIL